MSTAPSIVWEGRTWMKSNVNSHNYNSFSHTNEFRTVIPNETIGINNRMTNGLMTRSEIQLAATAPIPQIPNDFGEMNTTGFNKLDSYSCADDTVFAAQSVADRSKDDKSREIGRININSISDKSHMNSSSSIKKESYNQTYNQTYNQSYNQTYNQTQFNLTNAQPKLCTSGRLKIMSYNVCSDIRGALIRYSTTRNWIERSSTLISEINSYSADILCLQDVDHFKDFWYPNLAKLGYDRYFYLSIYLIYNIFIDYCFYCSVFKKRTDITESHSEGVLIAFKRDLFQLFKHTSVELNAAGELDLDQGSQFREKCKTDDVGLVWIYLSIYLISLSIYYLSF
jgi:hypothetical protein